MGQTRAGMRTSWEWRTWPTSANSTGTGTAKMIRLSLSEAGLQKDAAERRVSAYSKSMTWKVGLASALARQTKQAKAVPADELTSGLDPKASNEFSRLVRRLRQNGLAVLMAKHDLFRAREVGHRVGIMKHGPLAATLETAGISRLDPEKTYMEHMRN